MATDPHRRWCVFTSAGDRNVIRHWLSGGKLESWDLVVAYYGDSDLAFDEIRKLCTYGFRSKGSKFQNLRKLFLERPEIFEQYSHVWVCDDDIVMSTAQIDSAFELTETLGFWVAQPATSVEGKNSYWITCPAGPQWDYRVVNYVEVNLPIFRRDKLIEFLTVYDGSLTGWGIDYWYANLFQANDIGRFAVLDKIQVVNPRNQDKGGSEIEKLRPARLREADWNAVRQKFGLVEYPHKVFAYCRLAPARELLRVFDPMDEEYSPISPAWVHTLRGSPFLAVLRSRFPAVVRFTRAALLVKEWLGVARRSGWHDAIFLLKCRSSLRRQRLGVGHGFEM